MIEIQYLESTENLKRNIARSQGWKPSGEQATAIAACLRQGRLFLESAKIAPLEIRPLQLYYGITAYAKALVLAKNRKLRLDCLPHSHGIRDVSAPNARLENLKIAIEDRGAFQNFNDCAATLNFFKVLRIGADEPKFRFDLAKSGEIAGIRLTLKEIMSRILNVGDLYTATFDERANVDHVRVTDSLSRQEWFVDVTDPKPYKNIGDLIQMIEVARIRMPFLRRWSFVSASIKLGKTDISFQNTLPLDPKIVAMHLIEEFGQISCNLDRSSDEYFQDIEANLGTFVSGFWRYAPIYIQPIEGKYFSELSLSFLALHLLSSLVRYRPATWMHALSRSSNEKRTADDAMLALLEAFMEDVQSAVPRFVTDVLSLGLMA
ncbi:MAG: hypothetical protein EPN62_10000 [Candidimonas sp.]|nr:MAG: hypothetical protein EPN77_03430 [Candidimonas sp.]TAM23188.1 MAG: hypothetical protein EPN62_10000 [Candidimonas sp.]